MNIYIQVYDNEGAFSILEVAHPVHVVPDITKLDTTITKIINADPIFISNIILNEGSFSESIQELQSISALLNERSMSDKLGLSMHLPISNRFIVNSI